MILEQTHIRLLPEGLANKIAAGEVVQRPASVVKELVENSLDAGASKIEVHIKEAGKALIQIVDDGEGMGFQDALKCFARHATSKIREDDDLFSIQTMGFRGEALASIASVAQVELLTAKPDAEVGTRVVIEAGEVIKHEEAPHRKGTSISVKNLFYNVPARRKFLKSPPTELKAIIEDFTRLALARPDISFILTQNGTETYRLKACGLAQRIVDLLGKNFREQLASVHEETHFLKITGFIGKPDLAKSTKGQQFFFVNNRFVRNSYLHHGVMQAYEGLLETGQYPFYAIFLTLDPKALDVNVHPAKWEVKFEDERSIYAVLNSSVRKALSQHHFSPTIDFDVAAGLRRIEAIEQGKPGNQVFDVPEAKGSTAFKPSNFFNREEEAWSRFKNISSQMAIPPLMIENENETGKIGIRIESAINKKERENFAEIAPLFTLQLFNRFILTQRGESLLLIDQYAAHYRILFEHFIKENSPGRGSQQLLFPVTVHLDAGDFHLLKLWLPVFTEADFGIEIQADREILLTGVPTGVAAGEESKLFEKVLADLTGDLPPNQARTSLMQALAKRMATPIGKKLTTEQMEALVTGLFQCKDAGMSPEGAATYTVIGQEKMNALLTGGW